ncbi:MAG: acyloxyacyl hydrolase, partial [Pseudomonadota bacterium]
MLGLAGMTRDGWEKFAVLAALMGSAVFFASRAFAAEAVPWLDEMRIGAASTVPVGGGAAGTPFDASVELQALFSPLPSLAQPYDPNLSWLFSPRPLVGASISAEGKTDMAYLGLAWDVPISGPYFAEFFAGGLLHDQNLNKLYSDRPSPLTTRFLFHESIAIGRQIGPNWRIMAFADHSSNGDLVNGNVGINRVGVLLGDEFGASAKDAADSAPGKTPNSDLSAFSWAGPYVGFGVGLATDTIDFAAPAGLSGATEYKSVNLAAQGGYNWVIGRLVAGVEADAAVQNLNGNVLIGTAAVTARSHWLATARGRAGIDVDMPFIP